MDIHFMKWNSRSLRCRWTLKEAGLEYKSIDDRSLIRSDELKKNYFI